MENFLWNLVNEDNGGATVCFHRKMARKLQKHYDSGGLLRTDPEGFYQTFAQTRVGKAIMKQIKRITIEHSCSLIDDVEQGEREDIINTIMSSGAQMTPIVYYDYVNTKLCRAEDSYVYKYIRDGVRGSTVVKIPEDVYGFPSGGVEVRDFIYTYMHNWLMRQVMRWVDEVMLEQGT